MKCRSLVTLKTREFHIRKGEVYEFKVFGVDVKDSTGIVGDLETPYKAVVITNEKNESFTTNPTWFFENFITLEEERDQKLNEILR